MKSVDSKEVPSNAAIDKESEGLPSRYPIFFETLLKLVRKELESACIKGAQYLEENEVPMALQDDLRVAIGKTKLLTGKKFSKMEELIQINKEKNPSKVMVTEDDLEAFWKLIEIEIEEIYRAFLRNKIRIAAGWIPDEAQERPPIIPSSATVKSRAPVAAKSNAQKLKEQQQATKRKEMMKLAREKMKKNQESAADQILF